VSWKLGLPARRKWAGTLLGVWHRGKETRRETGRKERKNTRPLMTSIVVSLTRIRVFTKLYSPISINDIFYERPNDEIKSGIVTLGEPIIGIGSFS